MTSYQFKKIFRTSLNGPLLGGVFEVLKFGTTSHTANQVGMKRVEEILLPYFLNKVTFIGL